MKASFTVASKQAAQSNMLMLNNLQFANLFSQNMRAFNTKIFVEGLPLDWTDSQLQNRLKASGSVVQVRLFTNAQGQTTGKAVVEFENDESAEKAITDFNDVEVEGLQHKVRPFVDRRAGGVLPQRNAEDPSILARRIYITNVAYGATEEDIQEIAAEAAEIERVAIPKDREGRARGYAFVYVKNVDDVQKVVDQLQGKRIMSREVQAKKYEATERPAGGFRERSPRGGYNDRSERGGYESRDRSGGYEDRRGGFSEDRRGGYNEDRRGGYGEERRGGFGEDRRGGRGGYERDDFDSSRPPRY